MWLFDFFKKESSEPKKKSYGLPSIERQYECVRILAECYQNWKFDDLYPILSDDVKWFSQRKLDDILWKDNVIKYFKDKEKIIDEDYCCITQVVQLIWNMNRDSNVRAANSGERPGRVMLMYDDWKLCVLLSQYIKWEQLNMMVVPEYSWDEISSIWICIPDFYKFRSWWPWNWEQVDWWRWIPEYEETDTLRDEELCDFACHIVEDLFIRKEWYQVLFASNMLSAFPNFALKKNWKIILLIVRWWRAPNMPTLTEQEKEVFVKRAEKEWAELYFAPVGFWAADPIRFQNELFLRWDWYYTRFDWNLIPITLDHKAKKATAKKVITRKTKKTESKPEAEEPKNKKSTKWGWNIEEITCPECWKKWEFVMYDSVNTKLYPELKEKILDRSLFEFKCDNCWATKLVLYNCLYHDMVNYRIFYLLPDPKNDYILDDTIQTFKPLIHSYKTFRVARSINELGELIRIYDDWYNDVFMYFIKSLIIQNEPHSWIKEIYYLKSDKDYFVFYTIYKNGKENTLSFKRSEWLERLFNDMKIREGKEFLEINMDNFMNYMILPR